MNERQLEQAEAFADTLLEEGLKRNAAQVAQIPEGNPGECDTCGEWTSRLVLGVCAPCRDKYKLG